MIYIDPPYNTGKDFVYPDDFRDNIRNYLELTGQTDGEGRRVTSNTEASGRFHTDWLNMMYPRLKLARLLLSNGGVIFISVDDREVSNLKRICDEIFGEEDGFVATLVWQKRYSRENRGSIGDAHEYVLVYARSSEAFKERSGKIPLTEEQASIYKNPNNDPMGRWRGIPMTAQGFRPNQMYEITAPSGTVHTPPEGRCWSMIESEFQKLEKQGRIYFGKDGNSQPQVIRYLSEVEGVVPWTWLPHEETGHTDEAKKELYGLLGKGFGFDTPKPTRLIQRLLQIASRESDFIVLDFFAGSGTTAQAVFTANANDDGSRRVITVQLPEPTEKTEFPTIADITKERLRRAGKKVKEENPHFAGDTGFRVFKVDTSNIRP